MVKRTDDASPTAIQHMRIDHRRAHIFMAKQFLHCSNIVPSLKQMRCKAMP